jgi:uncharacterized phage protein gp47/JayE
MPFARPTLQDLIDRARADLSSRLPGADPWLRRSLAGALSTMHAGALHLLYGYLDQLATQILPDTAPADLLDRWCSIWGIGRNPPAAASGTVMATGADGSVIPAGTELQRSDGATFTTDAEAAIAGNTAALAVTAAAPGAAGNTDAGAALTFTTPIAGVSSSATVAPGGLGGGVDVEEDEDLRTRLLARVRQTPQGGAAADYDLWARQVPGVTRVWVRPGHFGVGTLAVFFMSDGVGSGIPAEQLGDDVQAHLDAVRPVTADVTALAPVAYALDLTIALTPDTSDVRTAVEAELTDHLLEAAEPGGTLYLSDLNDAISAAAGHDHHILTLPAADVVVPAGQVAILGTITWA